LILSYLISGFFIGTGAGGPLNNGAVSSAGFCQKKRDKGREKKKRIVRTTSILHPIVW